MNKPYLYLKDLCNISDKKEDVFKVAEELENRG